MSPRDYLAQLHALLPVGGAWNRSEGSNLSRVLAVIADALARVDARGDALLREADPRRAVELLADWERVTGIRADEELTQQERRGEVVSRLVTTGGQSRTYFIELARALGYEVTITEFRPFRAGRSVAGDALTNGPWRHTWRVNAPPVTIWPFRAGAGAAGEPLRVWGNERLESTIERYAPAHTLLQFGYGGN